MPALTSSASNPCQAAMVGEKNGAAGEQQQQQQQQSGFSRVGIKRLSWKNGRRMLMSASRADSQAGQSPSGGGGGGASTPGTSGGGAGEGNLILGGGRRRRKSIIRDRGPPTVQYSSKL